MNVMYKIIFVITVLTLSGCFKICKNYPSFDVVFETIQVNEKRVYISHLDTMEFNIVELTINEAEQRAPIFVMDQNCMYESNYQANSGGENIIEEYFRYQDDGDEIFWEILIDKNDFFDLTKSGTFELKDENVDTIINEKRFENVRVINDERNMNEKYDMIIHSNKDGLLGFRNKSTNQFYLLE